jgi:hypothetical protein
MNKILLSVACLLAFGLNLYSAQTVNFQPENLDFEESSAGKLPAFWIVPEAMMKSGFNAIVLNTDPYEGEMCCKLSRVRMADSALAEGIVQQRISAFSFRGKKISFSAALKGYPLNDTSSIHFFVYIRNSGNSFIYENLKDNPVSSNQWGKREIIVDIPVDAIDIAFGMSIHGLGDSYIDNVQISALSSKNAIIDNKSRSLSKSAIANITDFANIYGLIKYFSPAKEGLAADWDGILLNGLAEAEKGTKPEKFITTLNDLFKPVAPALNIAFSNENYKYEIPANALHDSAMVLLHAGAYSPFATLHFGTQHRNVYNSQKQREGSVMQIIDAKSARKKTIELTAMMKVEPADISCYSQLWLRVDREGGYVQSKRMTDPLKNSQGWVQQSIKVELGEDVTTLRIGLVLTGEGSAYFDDVKVKVLETGEFLTVNNPDFETNAFGKPSETWNFSQSVKSQGYQAEFVNSNAYSGKSSLVLKTSENDRIHIAQPGSIYTYTSKQGFTAKFPLCVYVDSLGTFPKAKSKLNYTDRPAGSLITGDDRLGRFAVLTDMYVFMKHFGENLPNYSSIDSLYVNYLNEFSNSINKQQFENSLNNYLAVFNEPNDFLWNGWINSRYSLPFRLIVGDDGRIFISQTLDSIKIPNGSEIIEVNGKKIADLTKNQKNGFELMRNSKEALAFRIGDKNSEVNVTIRDLKGKEQKMLLKRNTRIIDLQETRPPIIYSFDSTTIYVDLVAFNDKELNKYTENFKKMHNFIFDCRGAGNVTPHYLANFLGENLPSLNWKFPYFAKPFNPDKDYNKLGSVIKGTKILEDKNLYFLVDEKTIGLSSDLVTFVKKYKLGKIIGRAFKPSRPETIYYNLPGFYSLSFAPGDASWDDGSSPFTGDLQPDILVKFNKETVLNYLPYINEALTDILNNRKLKPETK